MNRIVRLWHFFQKILLFSSCFEAVNSNPPPPGGACVAKLTPGQHKNQISVVLKGVFICQKHHNSLFIKRLHLQKSGKNLHFEVVTKVTFLRSHFHIALFIILGHNLFKRQFPVLKESIDSFWNFGRR